MAPTLKKKPTNPYGPDDRVRAWQSFAHATGTVRAGDVLRGDDELVRQHWPWFEPVDTPTAEKRNIWAEMPAPPDHRDSKFQVGTNPLANVPPERLVRAKAFFWFDGGWAPGSPGEKSGKPSGFGWAINVGDLVEISNPVVRAHPEVFEFPRRDVTLADIERLTRDEEVN
jgi:hypothetical protein